MPHFSTVAKRLLLTAAVVITACGPVENSPKDSGIAAVDGGSTFDAGSELDSGSSVDSGITNDAGNTTDAGPTLDGGHVSTFHIQFDYQFDTKGMFTDPSHRAALAAAAKVWETKIRDEFDDVPAGTSLRIRHPEQPYDAGFALTINQPIDDVIIFVGSAPLISGVAATSAPSAALSTVTDPTVQAALAERFNGSHFEPWTGWISFSDSGRFFFDPTPETANDIPLDKTDFISTATHEIGHVLGFGTAAAFKGHIVSGGFTGSRATTLYGAPVPMSSDGSHVLGSVTFNGQQLLMDNAASVSGVRRYPTALDLAMLEDTGYQFWP